MKRQTFFRERQPSSSLKERFPAIDQQLALLRNSLGWDKQTSAEFQLENINRIIEAGIRHPFLANIFSLETRLKSFEEFRSLPFTDKMLMSNLDIEQVRANYDTIHSMTTGGSTGNPLEIFMDDSFRGKNHANTLFYLEVAGEDIKGTRNIRLHGDKLSETLLSEGRYWDVVDGRTLVMSCFHIDERTIEAYLAAIEDFDADYIHSYPSALHVLVRLAKAKGMTPKHRLKKIFCDCETLFPDQRLEFEEFFGCKVFNIYGHTEGACIGITFPGSNNLFFPPVVGYTELLKPDGSVVTEPGEKGEICVTGFNNTVSPFIRYRTGDIGILGDDTGTGLPRWFNLERVEGRLQDYLINKNGEAIPFGPALFDYNFDWRGIVRFKAIQEEAGSIRFLIAVNQALNIQPESIKNDFEKQMCQFFGNLFDFDIEISNEVDLSPIGKFRYLDQKLDINRIS